MTRISTKPLSLNALCALGLYQICLTIAGNSGILWSEHGCHIFAWDFLLQPSWKWMLMTVAGLRGKTFVRGFPWHSTLYFVEITAMNYSTQKDPSVWLSWKMVFSSSPICDRIFMRIGHQGSFSWQVWLFSCGFLGSYFLDFGKSSGLHHSQVTTLKWAWVTLFGHY